MGGSARPAEASSAAPKLTAPVVDDPEQPEQRFWIALSDGQVQELVQQEAARRGTGRGLLGVLLSLNGIGNRINLEQLSRDKRYQDRRVSQSVLLSLLVLGAFALGEVHSLNKLAGELGMANSTLWRYLKTWVAVGVLEERDDRRYQLAVRWRQELPKTIRRRSAAKAK